MHQQVALPARAPQTKAAPQLAHTFVGALSAKVSMVVSSLCQQAVVNPALKKARRRLGRLRGIGTGYYRATFGKWGTLNQGTQGGRFAGVC